MGQTDGRTEEQHPTVLQTLLRSYGDRTSAAAGPRPWNSLPVQLRTPDITYGQFRRQLKGSMNTALCDF